MTDTAAAAGLSEEEVAALREAVAPEAPSAQTASLGGGDRKARRKLPILERESVAFVEFVRRMMGRELRGACPVKLLDMELAGQLGMQHEAQTWLLGAALTLPDGPPLAYLGVSPRLGFHLIELAYGAPSTPAKSLPPRLRLTKVEKQTLFPSLEMLMGGLAKTLLPQDFEAARIEQLATPPELEAGPTTEAGVVTALELTLGEESVRIGICLTPRALERLSDGTVLAEDEEEVVQSPLARMRAHVEATEVMVVVDLGHAQVSVNTLASMNAGTVIWLDHVQSDPLVVCVEGNPKFLATPMQRAGAVGVKIVKRLA
jgi:flagellar motor switch protein FliM